MEFDIYFNNESNISEKNKAIENEMKTYFPRHYNNQKMNKSCVSNKNKVIAEFAVDNIKNKYKNTVKEKEIKKEDIYTDECYQKNEL